MDEAESVVNTDSGLPSDLASDSVSITSSNYIFRRKKGREYHGFADNPYPYPADDQEIIRLDCMHDAAKVLFHRNVLAPIEDTPGLQIVDLGTGSGKWAIEVADEFVYAKVRGLDLAPIQPTYIPLNCSFYVGDITLDLDEEMFPVGSVDLVHMRSVHAGIRQEKWPGVIQNIYRMLKPDNGWAQISEMDSVCIHPSVQPPSRSALWQYLTWATEFHERRGTNMQSAQRQRQLLEEAGFVDIQVTERLIDCGCYSRDPESRRAGILARYAYGSLIHVLGAETTLIDDEKEKQAFHDKVLSEFCSGEAPVGIMKHLILARKPPANQRQ